MNDMNIAEFCDKHYACPNGRDWALANCASMREAWDTARPEWLLWIATRPGVLDDRTLRLLAVRFARTVEHLMTDQRSHDALNVAERYASGLATEIELAAAWDAAWDAAGAAAGAAAWDAAGGAARAAAGAALSAMIREHTPNFRGDK